MDGLYYCTPMNNTCNKKDSCKRYMQAENNVCATLFKMMCNDNNDYILYIKHQLEEGENTCQN